MNRFFQEIIKLVIVVCFTVGGFLTFKSFYKQNQKHASNNESLGEKSKALRNYLLTNEKPQRIEVVNLSKRFESDVDLIKKMKIPQDKNSKFYVSIQFFTDETDAKAPLIAQIRFIETQSGNTIKEESLNLD